MKPGKITTLHDGVTIPEPALAKRRDRYRERRRLNRIVLFGAPLLLSLLFLDFLFLPNGNGRYSTVGAWRDQLVTGRAPQFKNRAYSSSMGVAWPTWEVLAWKDAEGWHAAHSGESDWHKAIRGGTPNVGWASGGQITLHLSVPDTRTGIWAVSTEILPEVWAQDPVTFPLDPTTLPAAATAEIRAALVRANGDVAGRAFDTAPVSSFFGAGWGQRELVPTGVVHNLIALIIFIGGAISLMLWIPAFRANRRIARGQCLRCRYDLRGVTLFNCPECSLAFGQTPTYPVVLQGWADLDTAQEHPPTTPTTTRPPVSGAG